MAMSALVCVHVPAVHALMHSNVPVSLCVFWFVVLKMPSLCGSYSTDWGAVCSIHLHP